MLNLRNLIFCILPITTTLVLAQSTPQPSTELKADPAFDFQELLNALPEESIHAALHKHLDTKYQDGVYEHNRDAVEAVHKDDPPTATKLLVGAALELLKRQNGNGTSAVVPASSVDASTSAAAVPTTTSPTAVVVPVEVATTDSAGSSSVLTTSAVATASVSVAVKVTTTNSAGSTTVSSTVVPAAVVTASDGKVTTSTVPTFNAKTVAPAPTSAVAITTTDSSGDTLTFSDVTKGKVFTTTNAKGSTFVTTITPDGGKIQSIVRHTSTLPNGSVGVVTSFADIQAATGTAAASASASATPSPRVQNGADSVKSRGFGSEAVALIGGAIGVAVFL